MLKYAAILALVALACQPSAVAALTAEDQALFDKLAAKVDAEKRQRTVRSAGQSSISTDAKGNVNGTCALRCARPHLHPRRPWCRHAFGVRSTAVLPNAAPTGVPAPVSTPSLRAAPLRAARADTAAVGRCALQ